MTHQSVQHHADSPSHIASAMGKDEHLVVMARAAASPLFVLPLAKRPGTFQTLLLQWQPPNRLLFTTVDEFKQWGPQAPPHLTVQLYDELADSHGVVLLRGDLINTGLINAAEVRDRQKERKKERVLLDDDNDVRLLFATEQLSDDTDGREGGGGKAKLSSGITPLVMPVGWWGTLHWHAFGNGALTT